MTGETLLKFLVPQSPCQKDFLVSALFADGAKESVLRCDWLEKYDCASSPEYTHNIGNDTALITVSRDLERKPEDFICEPLYKPKTDHSWCLCKIAENYRGTSEVFESATTTTIIIPGQPGSDSPVQVALIASLSAGLVILLVLVVFLIYKCYCRRTSSKPEQNRNVRPDESEPLNEAKKDAPKISATDSEKSSTAKVICLSCGDVQPIKETIPQTSEPSMGVPQISAADLQESSTPAVTAPPTETVPPKKGDQFRKNKNPFLN